LHKIERKLDVYRSWSPSGRQNRRGAAAVAAVAAAAAAVSVACSYPLIRIYIIKLDWRPGQFPRENDLLQRGVVPGR